MSEQTPEFNGPRGMSIDSLRKLSSLGLDNSLVSEDTRECRKCAKRGAIFLALMKETNTQTENDVLEAVMNLKYDMETMGKMGKCMRNVQKLMIDFDGTKWSYKSPPRPKDVWRWIRGIAEQYLKKRT